MSLSRSDVGCSVIVARSISNHLFFDQVNNVVNSSITLYVPHAISADDFTKLPPALHEALSPTFLAICEKSQYNCCLLQ